MNVLAKNKKAYHDYFIIDNYEAGIELKGMEVKSIKNRKTSISEAYVKIMNDQVFVINMHVKSWKYNTIENIDETRRRKLLLHKKQIEKLKSKVKRGGYTLVPLRLYRKNSLIKLQIGLAKGKKQHDKREELAKKAQQRDMQRNLKDRYR
ncbi:MAG: SsrA-binding protein SmpB [Fusobacteriota bacterium]